MTAFDPAGPHDVGYRDVSYGGPPDAPLRARVYRPEGVGGALPALVDVHGGAWCYFDRKADAYFDMALAACGVVVVALDFRQGPAHRYPTAVADVVAGIRWVRAHAGDLGVRPDAVGLIGGSSGGHLILLAALGPRGLDPTPVAGVGDPSAVDASVAFALPLWPIADPLARYRYLLARRADAKPSRDPFFDVGRLIAAHDAFFADEATMARASVPRLLDDGEAQRLPPIWVAHPEHDENVTLPMTERLVDAYRRAGGEAELEVFPGVGHAFANFPGEPADRGIARMKDFVARRLAALGGGA